MEIVKNDKDKYQQCVVDEMAVAQGITALWLPPYHCDLNPIEFTWAQVKGYAAKNNKTFKMTQVKQLILESINNISADKWQECIIKKRIKWSDG